MTIDFTPHSSSHPDPSEPIPHIDTATDPITGTDDLRQRWRALMGPLGFGEAILWFAFIDDDGCLIPALNKVSLPHVPDPGLIDVLMQRVGESIDRLDPVTFACLITRPGTSGLISVDDQMWAAFIEQSARRHGVPIYPVHRADDVVLLTVPSSAEAVA